MQSCPLSPFHFYDEGKRDRILICSLSLSLKFTLASLNSKRLGKTADRLSMANFCNEVKQGNCICLSSSEGDVRAYIAQRNV